MFTSSYLYDLALTTESIGRNSQFFGSARSTNLNAAAMIGKGAEHGTLIVADQQTAGRGRMERKWFSPAMCNIYASLILRPETSDPMRLATLPILAGFTIVEAIVKIFPELQPGIKWPNDIWIREKKLCGILCEMQIQGNRSPAIVLGFGINVNLSAAALPREILSTATSLKIETERTCSRAKILSGILNTFEPLYLQWEKEGLSPFLSEIQEYDYLKGEEITMSLTNEPLHGFGNGIRSDGGLRILLPTGSETVVYSGEVSHIRKFYPKNGG